MPYFYRLLSYLRLELTPLCGSIPENLSASGQDVRQGVILSRMFGSSQFRNGTFSWQHSQSFPSSTLWMPILTTKVGKPTYFLTQNSAHIKVETARMDVPLELGTSNQGETGVGQEGKAVHHAFESTLGSP